MRLTTPVRAESKGSQSRLCLLAFLYSFVRTLGCEEHGAKYAPDYCGPSAVAGEDLCASEREAQGTTASWAQ